MKASKLILTIIGATILFSSCKNHKSKNIEIENVKTDPSTWISVKTENGFLFIDKTMC